MKPSFRPTLIRSCFFGFAGSGLVEIIRNPACAAGYVNLGISAAFVIFAMGAR